MAITILSGDGALDTSGATLFTASAACYVRVLFKNTNTTTRRRVIFKIRGANYAAGRVISEFVLEPNTTGVGAGATDGSEREVGPVSLQNTEKVHAAQDTGTDVAWSLTGEAPS